MGKLILTQNFYEANFGNPNLKSAKGIELGIYL